MLYFQIKFGNVNNATAVAILFDWNNSVQPDVHCNWRGCEEQDSGGTTYYCTGAQYSLKIVVNKQFQNFAN